MISKNKALQIGFTELPHFTIGNSLIYDLGKKRHLSLSSLGTPNETLFICERELNDSKVITDLICLSNYDYNGNITEKKLKKLIGAIDNITRSNKNKDMLYYE